MKAIAAMRGDQPLPGLDAIVRRSVSVLGVTGSIGCNTLDVVAHTRASHGEDAFPIEAITAGGNVEKLAEQARKFRPKLAVIGDERRYAELKDALSGSGIEIAAGTRAVTAAAERPSDLAMVAIMGAAALKPALAAAERGAQLALANKECVVAAGAVFARAVEAGGAAVIPVDSEHNAVFQLFGTDEEAAKDIEKVTLTASGGPFRDWPLERMRAVTPEQAVAHPNWAMGAKISVDSATLMNKGLELIEAHFLFALPPDALAVVVHPQSVVHCLVGHADGSTLAHLSPPDMRTPIAHALAWPRRISSPSRKLDLAEIGQLTFQAPDQDRFPCLRLAIAAMRQGGFAPTILNAANEIAVEWFLTKKIGFLDIPKVVEKTLTESVDVDLVPDGLDSVLAADAEARIRAGNICRRMLS